MMTATYFHQQCLPIVFSFLKSKVLPRSTILSSSVSSSTTYSKEPQKGQTHKRRAEARNLYSATVTHFLDPLLLFTKESSPPDEHRHLLLPLFIYSFHPKFIKCLCQAGLWNTKFLILNNLLSDSRITYKITR